MRLGFLLCACSLLVACDQKETDIGDLPVDSESGTEGGGTETGGTEPGETSAETSATTVAPDCAGDGENCLDGCCDGFGCNFANLCQACDGEGEAIHIDGPGCCEDLEASPAFVCYSPACGEAGCDECAVLSGEIHDETQQYAQDCVQEACLGSRELVLRNDAGAPGLECTGPDGSEDCAGTLVQQYNYQDGPQSIHLSFDPAILDGYSTAAFNQHFDSFAGQITIPDANTPLTFFPQSGTISDFTYADGRLQFTIDIPLDNPFAIIQSDADDCFLGDIGGECGCYYENLGNYRLVVDLEIEAP